MKYGNYPAISFLQNDIFPLKKTQYHCVLSSSCSIVHVNPINPLLNKTGWCHAASIFLLRLQKYPRDNSNLSAQINLHKNRKVIWRLFDRTHHPTLSISHFQWNDMKWQKTPSWVIKLLVDNCDHLTVREIDLSSISPTYK